MDNSIYVTLSRELSLFKDMDVTANNIANANTTGYGSEHILFSSYVAKDINQGYKNPMAFALPASTFRDTDTGPMKVTGNQLDVAIQGEGYFQVQTPLGDRYTRAGNFMISGGGVLTTVEGYPVLDASNKEIILPQNATTIQIGSAGNIKVNGEDLGSINVVQFDNPQLLERLNGRLFKSPVQGSPADNFTVVQGMLEESNVKTVNELTHMITLSHTVADTAKFIEVVYDLERKTSNTWAQQS